MKTPIPNRRKRVEAVAAAIRRNVADLPADERVSNVVELVETALRLEIEGFSVRIVCKRPTDD
jgi:hypothetical protein